MDYPYSINDISSTCKVSKQSIYTLIKKNQSFINDNSTRRQRKIYYSQAAMDFFVSYYCPEEAPEEGKNGAEILELDIKAPEAEKSPLEASYTDEAHKSPPDVLEAEIEALKAEIEALRAQLEAKEVERLELLRQNGALILTLQQEKQEKMLFLPAPKKSFTEKMKSIFARK